MFHPGKIVLNSECLLNPVAVLCVSNVSFKFFLYIFPNPQFMRLLHTTTLRLKEFSSCVPPYAILSHTWEDDEVLFRDIQYAIPEMKTRKAGYRKFENACKRAHESGFDYIWIDTCCIDKESSAELSEAINSMYRYYAEAEVCYVYLSDLPDDTNPRDDGAAFSQCRWFTRGWTLQELLAPDNVVFFTQNWLEVGTKNRLADIIACITGVAIDVLLGGDCSTISIAKRMLWAAHRQTTREEDRAYSLMGIFGVHIPPLYGEGGSNAFMRLQQEIIKYSDDRSIFAWIASDEDGARGLFAKSPSEFGVSDDVYCSIDESCEQPYSMTNIGLHIDLALIPLPHNCFLAFLDCQLEQEGASLAIYLQRLKGQQYVRCQPHELVISDLSTSAIREKATRQAVYVKDPSTDWRSMSPPVDHRSLPLRVKLLSSLCHHFSLQSQLGPSIDSRDHNFHFHDLSESSGDVVLDIPEGKIAILQFTSFKPQVVANFFVVIGQKHGRVFLKIVPEDRRLVIEALRHFMNGGVSIRESQRRFLSELYIKGIELDQLNRFTQSSPLADHISVYATMQNAALKDGHVLYLVKFGAIDGKVKIQKALTPSQRGFTVEMNLSGLFTLKEYFPVGVYDRKWLKNATNYLAILGDEDFYVMLFESRGWQPLLKTSLKVAVVLGIHGSANRAWSVIVPVDVQAGERSAETLWNLYHQSSRFSGELESRDTIAVVKADRSNCLLSDIMVKVSTAKRKVVQHGSHQAHISFEGQYKLR